MSSNKVGDEGGFVPAPAKRHAIHEARIDARFSANNPQTIRLLTSLYPPVPTYSAEYVSNFAVVPTRGVLWTSYTLLPTNSSLCVS